jgi:excisionase family DNA binding protein
MTDEAGERWVDVQAIVSRLGVHEQTVRRWIKRGELPAIMFGRRSGYRVREGDLQAFIDAQYEKTGKAAA